MCACMYMQGSHNKCIWTRLSKRRKLICRLSEAFCRNQDPGSAAGPLEGLRPGCGTRPCLRAHSTPSLLPLSALLCLDLHVSASSSSTLFTSSVRPQTLQPLAPPSQGQASTLDSNIDGQGSGVSMSLGPHCGCAGHS